jgi:hypothetical protein
MGEVRDEWGIHVYLSDVVVVVRVCVFLRECVDLIYGRDQCSVSCMHLGSQTASLYI